MKKTTTIIAVGALVATAIVLKPTIYEMKRPPQVGQACQQGVVFNSTTGCVLTNTDCSTHLGSAVPANVDSSCAGLEGDARFNCAVGVCAGSVRDGGESIQK